MTQGKIEGFAKPPEGVIAGENVPRENELTDKEEQMIEKLANQMMENGEPYTLMSQEEREQKAQDVLQAKGVIR